MTVTMKVSAIFFCIWVITIKSCEMYLYQKGDPAVNKDQNYTGGDKAFVLLVLISIGSTDACMFGVYEHAH